MAKNGSSDFNVLTVATKPVLTTDSQFSLVQGFELSVNSGNTQYIDMAAGKANVLNNSNSIRYTVTSSSTITKQLNAAWAIGTNAGGLLTGSSFPVSTTLHAYIMRRRTDGTVDHGFHTSATQTTFTDGSSNVWDLQLHMSITTLASSIRGIKQVGNLVTYIDPVQSDVAAAIGTTAALYTLSIPTGIKLYPVIRVHLGVPTTSTTYCFYYFSDPDTTDSTPSNALAVGSSGLTATTPTTPYNSTPLIDNIQCDTSARIRGRSNVAAASLNNSVITTYGYYHPRGGNPTAAQAIVLNNGFTYVGYFAGGTPTATPNNGDTWRELSSANLPLMDWYWDGSTWKSINFFKASWGSISGGISATSIYYDGIPLDKNYDVWAEAFTVSWSSSSLTSSNYWSAQASYVTKNTQTANAIGSALDNRSNTNSVFVTQTTTLNTLITAANFGLFRLAITKVGTPGVLPYATAISYRYSRP